MEIPRKNNALLFVFFQNLIIVIFISMVQWIGCIDLCKTLFNIPGESAAPMQNKDDF
jgi:hypothetical protein